MKKIYYFSSIIFLYALFISCGKGFLGDARVDGIVKDKTTEEAIPGATVYLLESENDYCLFCPTATFIIDSTTSDNEGCFEFSYDNKNSYTYSVNAVKVHYIDNQLQTYINNLGSGLDIEVLLDPEAFLSIHYKNIPPTSPSDNFDINGYITDNFNGEEVDTIVVYRTYGNILITLYWALYGEYSNSISMTCPSFDTTYYEILY